MRKNASGFPTGICSPKTPPRKVWLVAILALQRDMIVCDWENGLGQTITIVEDDRVYRVITMWVRHTEAHGVADPFTGLIVRSFDLSGRLSSCKPTLIAHRGHGACALTDDDEGNAVVQSIFTNFLIRTHQRDTPKMHVKESDLPFRCFVANELHNP
ncbi:unnamed protein product [Sympodiomycopsis kandeliae]